MSSLTKRLDRLERGREHPTSLSVLHGHELEALLDALKEEDPGMQEVKLSAIDLCPRSEQALIDFIAEMQDQNDGKHGTTV